MPKIPPYSLEFRVEAVTSPSCGRCGAAPDPVGVRLLPGVLGAGVR